MAPDGLVVPAATLRVMLARGRPIELVYTGHAFEPLIRNGRLIRVAPTGSVRRGDLALCDVDGWGDVRRVIGHRRDGAIVSAIDAIPRGREIVSESRLLGIVRGVRGAGGGPGRTIAAMFPLWSRLAAGCRWCGRILDAPLFGDHADESVREKYEGQIERYVEMIEQPPDIESLDRLSGRLDPGGRVLIAGSGVGSEVIHLCRAGYRAEGFDFSRGMVEQGRRQIGKAGVRADLRVADLSRLELPEREFDAAYITPLVYSFVAGRRRRIDSLRRLGRHVRPGGPVVFTVQRLRTAGLAAALFLCWLRARRVDNGVEFGDWYTTFMTPRGRIGQSFLHVSTVRQVVAEAREAGFQSVERCGPAQFMVADFADPDAGTAGAG